jgi:hypothetical protein
MKLIKSCMENLLEMHMMNNSKIKNSMFLPHCQLQS